MRSSLLIKIKEQTYKQLFYFKHLNRVKVCLWKNVQNVEVLKLIKLNWLEQVPQKELVDNCHI